MTELNRQLSYVQYVSDKHCLCDNLSDITLVVGRLKLNDTPYNRVAKLTCVINAEPGVTIEFLPELEASFDCIVCKRTLRTIVLHPDERWPKCTGRQNCNGFCGQLTEFTQTCDGQKFTGIYVVRYACLSFVDPKYDRPSTGNVPWGRPHFLAACPSCGNSRYSSTQTNTVRPFTEHCKCGVPLYTEVENANHRMYRIQRVEVAQQLKIRRLRKAAARSPALFGNADWHEYNLL